MAKFSKSTFVDVDINFDWTPDPLVAAGDFSRVAAELDNQTIPLEASKAAVAASIEAHFDSETAPDGRRWERLSALYEERKEADGYGGEGILVRDGRLKEWATNPKSLFVRDNALFINTEKSPRYGKSQKQIWARHQFGDRPGFTFEEMMTGQMEAPVGLPARPYLGVDEEGGLEVLEIFDDWVDGILTGLERHKPGPGGPSYLGPIKYHGNYPAAGFTQYGQPIVRIPGVGPRFGRGSGFGLLR